MKSDMEASAGWSAQDGRRYRQYDTFHTESLFGIVEIAEVARLLSRLCHHMDERVIAPAARTGRYGMLGHGKG